MHLYTNVTHCGQEKIETKCIYVTFRCSSFVGRVKKSNAFPQQINLMSEYCTQWVCVWSICNITKYPCCKSILAG